MAEKGLLTSQHAELRHDHRFLGNDAVHEFKAPTQESLSAAIDVIEHTLENVYEIGPTGRRIRPAGEA